MSIKEALDAAKLKWNSEADKYNQWDNLGQDEKDELIAQFIQQNKIYRQKKLKRRK